MDGNEDDFVLPNKVYKVAVKTLRYFPLIPRLKRLFMCPNTAEALRWHDEQRLKDGCIRHPSDGQAWKNFDSRYPNFSKELRNLRLGLASDDFNPFQTMNVAHNTWPIVLMVYNVSPWMSMKSEYCMFSLLIPGPCSPGNNIDIFLQPLIEELTELWELEIDTYDSFKKETFRMYAALLWKINDFPAQKTIYMDHRRFLPVDNAWSSNKRSFNGKTEFRDPPRMLTGEEVLDMIKYNLDVMHIEKNIVDSIVGTLLDIPGKTKDHVKARYDLKEMGIQKNPHPKNTKDGKRTKLARACFSMTKGEKSIFCGVLKKTKLPDESASNISRCVQQEERKLYCYKTHDAHFMLHYLLQIPIKSILPDHVAILLVPLCSFFRQLCQKEIFLEGINGVDSKIVETLCQYLHEGVKTRFNRVSRNNDEGTSNKDPDSNLFTNKEIPLGEKKGQLIILDEKSLLQANAYVLNSCVNMEPYIREYGEQQKQAKRKRKWNIVKDQNEDFIEWFTGRAIKDDDKVIKSFSAYVVNGYRFHTKWREVMRKMQNNSVTVVAETTSFASVKDKKLIKGPDGASWMWSRL
ncbi:uncharacterized protein [Arachis hypogaea]|uniref:uncharacterized protein n=1 Tax=Arachis hypogaea TaxID=3818 RepID=UPI000DEC2C39|nr:uncharacterized protein LOC112709103 [Arachis hypogaea]